MEEISSFTDRGRAQEIALLKSQQEELNLKASTKSGRKDRSRKSQSNYHSTTCCNLELVIS